MRKFLILSLSLLIVILSFSFCFAANNEPFIIPVAGQNDTNVGYFISNDGSNYGYLYRANNSPVYVVFYDIGSGPYFLAFSDSNNSRVWRNSINKDTGVVGTVSNLILNRSYNGYYYVSDNAYNISDDSIIMYVDDADSVTDVIDYIDKSVFSTTFDLTYLVNGSVSWLSTFAQAAKNNALLLFFVVFIFVGIGIGLLNRFRRG